MTSLERRAVRAAKKHARHTAKVDEAVQDFRLVREAIYASRAFNRRFVADRLDPELPITEVRGLFQKLGDI